MHKRSIHALPCANDVQKGIPEDLQGTASREIESNRRRRSEVLARRIHSVRRKYRARLASEILQFRSEYAEMLVR